MTAAEPGRRVAGRYHLIEPIGRGGMGIVWRAHDELLDRPVAVKEVRYNGAVGDELADLNRRTMREARAAGRLTHPNVVVVHDVIEEDGRPWIVMQLVPSRSLGQVIREEGPLPPERVAHIGLEVLKALRSAHAMGVLHRDVKPENVLLADDGRVVLTDFGIARVETDSTMTRTGLVGTPAFMPPERLRGAPAQRESDLWSLGATLYAAVEGRPPHDKGAPLPTMHAVLMDEPEPAVHAGRLAPLIEGLLRKDPAERPTYDQIERMLRRALEPEPTPPPAPPPPRTGSRVPQTGDAAPPPAAPAKPRPRGGPAASPGAAVPETGLSLGAEAGAPPRPESPAAGKAERGAAARDEGAGRSRPGAAKSAAGAAARGKPAGKASAASAAGTASGGTSAAGEEAAGPDDPTLPKNQVARPAADGPDAAGKPAAGTSGSARAKSTGTKSGGAKSGAAKATEASDPDPADTIRTQKIGSWALETLGVGRLSRAKDGDDAEPEKGEDDGGKPGKDGGGEDAGEAGGRRLGAFASASSGTPRTRLGAFASRTGEDDDADRTDASGEEGADAAASGRPRDEERPPGERADSPGTAVPERDGDDAAKKPAAKGSTGEKRPAATATKGSGGTSPAASARAAQEEDARAGKKADPEVEDRTRRLHEWPVLPDDEPAEPRDAQGPEDEDTAAPADAEPAAKADSAAGRSGTASATAGPKEGTAAAGRPARRTVRRMSPFPAPYSRPDPGTRAGMTGRPAAERPRRHRPTMVVPTALQRRITSTRLPARISPLLANPTVRIVLVAVPVIILVAIVAALLGMRDARNEVARQSGDPAGAPATTQPGRTGANAFNGSSGTAQAKADGKASASPSAGDGADAKTEEAAGKRPGSDGVPKGWRRYTDPTGFSLALPKGWKVQRREGSRVFFRGNLRSTFLLIDQTRSPKPNAKRDWLAQERATRRNFPGYKRVRIKSVDYFKTAADWEWTYYSRGAKLHVINRGFVTGKRRGYAIYWSTLHKNWKKNYRYFEVFVDTFRPAK